MGPSRQRSLVHIVVICYSDFELLVLKGQLCLRMISLLEQRAVVSGQICMPARRERDGVLISAAFRILSLIFEL